MTYQEIKKASGKMEGWRKIIQKTDEKLNALNDPKLEFFPYQKYGTLRYNTGMYSSDEIEEIIDEAEAKSEHTCIACGGEKDNPESMLCDVCKKIMKQGEEKICR